MDGVEANLAQQVVKSGLLDRIRELVEIVGRGGGAGTSLDPAQMVAPSVAGAGRGLELWVKHFFAGTLGYANSNQVASRWDEVFSFYGGTNNPPDFMVRGSIAAEVKKSDSKPSGTLQLNSSWPLRFMKKNDPHITAPAREAEDWEVKPMYLIVGFITKDGGERLRALWIVDGRCFSDVEEVYVSLFNDAKNALLELGATATKEIGRFNSLGAGGHVSLRVRGMWQIAHPAVIFNDIFARDFDRDFTLNVLIPNEDFLAFDESSRSAITSLHGNGLMIEKVATQDPRNVDLVLDCRLIKGSW